MTKTKKAMIITSFILISLALGIFFFLKRDTFGTNPEGNRLKRIAASPNYINGSFQNLSPTEVTLKGASFFKMLKDYFNKSKNTLPDHPIPSVKTDLTKLSEAEDKPVIVWFGHSSYLIKSKGKNILVDPVFSGYASPVSFFGKAFEGSNTYSSSDMPNIDALIITHDHYDHLDYETVKQLQSKVKKVYTPLGVGAHLELWGFDKNQIEEFDWWDAKKVSEDMELIATPARHFSGRSFTRGKTLWASFVLKIDGYTLFIGGDSGYDSHFKTIGQKYGPFDLAILECGQYGKNWPYIHMLPEETVQAAKDLNTKTVLPVHWAKFVLALHDWNEPIKRFTHQAEKENVKYTTPLIGEVIVVDSLYPHKKWGE